MQFLSEDCVQAGGIDSLKPPFALDKKFRCMDSAEETFGLRTLKAGERTRYSMGQPLDGPSFDRKPKR